MPFTEIWKLKFVIALASVDAFKVTVAEIDCLGASTTPPRFQVIVSGPLALVGLQLFVPRLSVIEVPPVFFT